MSPERQAGRPSADYSPTTSWGQLRAFNHSLFWRLFLGVRGGRGSPPVVCWARRDFTLLFGGPVFISATVSDVLLSPNPLNSALRSLDKEMVKTFVPAVFICAFVGDAD